MSSPLKRRSGRKWVMCWNSENVSDECEGPTGELINNRRESEWGQERPVKQGCKVMDDPSTPRYA